MGYPDDLIHMGGTSLDELKYQAERGDLGTGNPDELIERALANHGDDETVFIERELAEWASRFHHSFKIRRMDSGSR